MTFVKEEVDQGGGPGVGLGSTGIRRRWGQCRHERGTFGYHSKIPLHIPNGCHKKGGAVTRVGEEREDLEPPPPAGVYVK